NSSRDGPDGRSGGEERLRVRARGASAHSGADADQLRRVESGAGQSGDGCHGAGRGNVPAADVSTEAGIAREDPEGPQRAATPQSGAGVSLEQEIAQHVGAGASADRDAVRATFARLREALSSGQVRAAEPDRSNVVGWRVNTWVKQGILLGFKFGDNVDVSADHGKW